MLLTVKVAFTQNTYRVSRIRIWPILGWSPDYGTHFQIVGFEYGAPPVSSRHLRCVPSSLRCLSPKAREPLDVTGGLIDPDVGGGAAGPPPNFHDFAVNKWLSSFEIRIPTPPGWRCSARESSQKQCALADGATMGRVEIFVTDVKTAKAAAAVAVDDPSSMSVSAASLFGDTRFLLNNEKFSDVQFRANPTTCVFLPRCRRVTSWCSVFYAHKSILAARCQCARKVSCRTF